MTPGTVLGHYRILGPLGKGGMGEVYLAEDTKLNRRVALKLLPAALAGDPERRKRLEREAQTIAALNHPGIVTIFSVEVDGPTPFLTMEYVEGQSLRQAIPAGGAAVDALLKIGIGIADAVAAAHQRGIVHRDLKPANVMVAPDGRVKVLDFGLAKARETEAAAAADVSTRMVKDDLTGEGRIVGTVAYMSPEQAEGKPVDQQSDIFSLGVVLHEMATGERPFKGDTEISIISAIIKDTPVAVTDSRPDLPMPFARIVKRCLVKDPQRRYQSARDLQNDLEDLKQDVDSGVLSTPSRAAAPPAAPARRVPRSVVYGSAAGLVIAAAAGAWWTFTHRPLEARTFVVDRLTRLTETGTATLAAISPDARYVAHVKIENQRPGLWVRQTGTTSDVRILAPGDFRIDGIAFSPDGNFVYYSTYPRGSGVATLYKVPALGGQPLRVLDDVDTAVSFSPDGSQFSFLRGRPAENIMMLMVAGVDGTGSRQVAAPPAQPNGLNADPAPWSPDGKTIAATGHTTVSGGGRNRLVAVDAASGRLTPFGGDWPYIHGVAWMPDGKSVVIAAVEKESEQAAQLWQVGWPGGERVRLTSGVNGYDTVGLAADGRTIATIEAEAHSNIWIYPMNGGSPRQITSVVRGNRGGGGIAWTPSGRIVYAAQPSGDAANQLFVMDADGSHSAQITTLRNFAAQPSVSPDGRWLYFNGGADTSVIWRLPLAGGDPQQLTHGPSDFRALASPDGKFVYYTANEDGRNVAMKLPVDGGTPTPLTRPELRFSAGSVSADGSKLHGSAWNVSARGTRMATVSTIDGSMAFIQNAPPRGFLSPDWKSWIIADVRNNIGTLLIKPVGGGPERTLGELGADEAWRFALSPDGRSLAVVRGRSTSDVVLIRAK